MIEVVKRERKKIASLVGLADLADTMDINGKKYVSANVLIRMTHSFLNEIETNFGEAARDLIAPILSETFTGVLQNAGNKEGEEKPPA